MSAFTDPAEARWAVAGCNDHGTHCDELVTAPSPGVLAKELARGIRLGWRHISIAAFDPDNGMAEMRRWAVARYHTDDVPVWAVQVPNDSDCWVELSAGGWQAIVHELVADLWPGWGLDAQGNLLTPLDTLVGF